VRTSSPDIGDTISHYTLLDHLGSGGMGIVYKARDLKLGRLVALKFLPPELVADPQAKQRFIHEARAASALQHKNICVVHDIDETEDGHAFISMECLDGETLKTRIAAGPLDITDALHITTQIAQGLASAHARGVVHRDIKPGNVMITKDHVVKILDFGVASMPGHAGTPEAGTTFGTLAYMSPEQARGEEADQRTDTWSLGVVLYEMLTGRLPFSGPYDQATLYALGNEPHPSPRALRPEIPLPVERIIDRCLEKLAAARFPDARAILDELQHIDKSAASTRSPAIKSLAVLPFADISQDNDNRYFSDGLTEEIISKLSRLRRVKIVPRASVMSYDRAGKPAKQIAAELRVQYLLEGSVRKYGTQLRITTQLVDADQDAYLWAESYDGTMEEVFDIQEQVASRIVKALRVRLTPDEKKNLKRRPTANSDAYQLYLMGRFFWSKRTKQGLETAIVHFLQAIEQDKKFALAWAGIADAHNLLSQYAGVDRKASYATAMTAVLEALALDDNLAEAHTSLGLLLMLFEWDWAGAGREFQRALHLDPSYATAHHWYAQWLLFMGRHDEALSTLVNAIALDPVSPAILNDMGFMLYYTRDYAGAVGYAQKTLQLDPHFITAHRLLSLAYQGLGKHDQAIAENRLWVERAAKGDESFVTLAQCYAAAGRREEAVNVLSGVHLPENPDGNVMRGIALVYAALGEIDNAFAWLEKAFAVKSEALGTLKVDPKLDPLRSDPRFAVLVRRVGLEQRS
jgi:serine/threonine protein kinase/Flp pilus assembly protein TadD